MNRVDHRTVREYMRAFVDYLWRTGSVTMRSSSPKFAELAEREDFVRVIHLLEAQGLVAVTESDKGDVKAVRLTPAGISYFEDSHDARVERLWTRGLAIASIAVSVAALIVSIVALFR